MPTAPTPAAPAPAATSHLRAVPVSLTAAPGAPHRGDVVIDCDVCMHRETATCDDCVVSFLIDRTPEDAVVIDADEARAVRLLADAGLVPDVRHARRVG